MEEHRHPDIVSSAVATAEKWLSRANALTTDEEKESQAQLAWMLDHPGDKVVLIQLLDRCFRTRDKRRVADQIAAILKSHGVPHFFSAKEKVLAEMFLTLGRHLPFWTVPKMVEKIRRDTRRVIIDGDPGALRAHLRQRRAEGVRMNLNHLGEAVLGEAEAARRLEAYLADLERRDIEAISVKISTIYSQLNPLAMRHGVDVLSERLATLYHAARSNRFEREDGSSVPKLVYLDMEAFCDLEMTRSAFTQTLDRAELIDCNAGIVLQAYLPDSFFIQQQLTEWARRRVAGGGSPITLRLVKGANMEMELLEAAHRNWPPAVFDTKLDTDTNFKRMVRFGLRPGNAPAVHLGIASHNLFDLAYAWHTAKVNGVAPHCHFEMLEGMADPLWRALREDALDVLLYAPVADRDDFINALAYLVRRLDENTAPDNFLRHAPGLKPGSADWRRLSAQFEAACARPDTFGPATHRVQDRRTETFPKEMGTWFEGEFHNEPDTDWSLTANRHWAESIRERWMAAPDSPPMEIPLVVDGREIRDDREERQCLDPSRLPQRIPVARFRLATIQDVDAAVAAASADTDGWRRLPLDERHYIFSAVAAELRKARGDLIGAAAASTGKLFTESDPEVSEAVDFAEYYPHSARAFAQMPNVNLRGKGVGVVISPWNFPIAIPCGGLVAALAAGNTVVFKPSSEAVPVAWELCQCFWRAGISQRILQFVPCSGESAGAHLAGHPGVDFVILTGGTDTGLAMLRLKPDLQLHAETGGKNATIVTAMSDRDQAIKNVVHSAFSNAGQKCSSTSLLILEKEVYEDDDFKRKLVDAAQSWPVGACWDFSNRMGPLIRPPAGRLERALTRLEPLESWALEPRENPDNPHLWTPGIKYGVQPGSVTHTTEFFGPLLGVMRADDLEHAVELANQTGYGLTAALESLDEREQAYWKASVRAGNLYINRGTTGAVTLRQPFGGMGKSALGPAIKAGGPNYVLQFMTVSETAPPRVDAIREAHPLLGRIQAWQAGLRWGRLAEWADDLQKTSRAFKSYLFQWEQEFGVEKDYFHLRGQDNLHRYRPIGTIVVRLHPDDTLFDALARVAAARIAGNTVTVSVPGGMHSPIVDFLEHREGRDFLGPARLERASDEQLTASLSPDVRVRYAAPDRVPADILAAAARNGHYIARAAVLTEGRLELLHYVQNQSVCDNFHRYGNLGARAMPEATGPD